MHLYIFIMISIAFLYTIEFGIILWKEKNKPGSVIVFFLALVIAIVPFFTLTE